MTPTQTVMQAASKSFAVVDKNGRRLLLRHLTALDTLRLFKAAGPVLSQNEPWLSMSGLALSVLEIDGVPVPQPATESQIESLVDRLGDMGLAAIADRVADERDATDPKQHVGNSPGTPS